MIQEFVNRFMDKKGILELDFSLRHPGSYKDIVQKVISLINEDSDYEYPDPNNIVEIDHGNYQGTLLYIIPECGYQPYRYWYVRVSYGSCSGCDTLYSIRGYSDELPSEQQVSDYLILALHIVQGIHELGEGCCLD